MHTTETLTARIMCWATLSLVALLTLAVAVIGPARFSEPTTLLGKVLAERRLTVLTRDALADGGGKANGPGSFDHDLIHAFARSLGVDIDFRTYESVPELIDALMRGEGHLIAAALPMDLALPAAVRFGPPYSEARLSLVCHRYGPVPHNIPDLEPVSVSVFVEGLYEARLNEFKQKVPGLDWTAVYGPTTKDLIGRVAAREVDCTMGDSTEVAVERRDYPELIVPFDVSGPRAFAWVVPARAHGLSTTLNYWFAKASTRQHIASLEEQHFGHVPEFDYVDLARFERRMVSRLPRYEPYFRQAAEETGLPWSLLAAVAYQESHWRPLAKSPTGVRGIMMLTRATARDLGIEDRLDPEQSIIGGARYLAGLIRRIPESIDGQDRLWFALAAYNVGFGHVMDARILATRRGLNPDLWSDVKKTLPLLRQKAYYRTVPHGYARGTEPVHYVQQVRHYLDILERRREDVRAAQMTGEEPWAL